MSPLTVSIPPRFPMGRIALATVVMIATIWWATPAWRPNVGLLVAASPVIQIHVATALGALAIGIALMSGRKGRTLHRALGWTWVILMLITAIATLFIRDINAGSFSWIHGFSFYVLGAVPLAVWFARRHQVRAHSRFMTGIFVGALIIAGGFAFVPGRLMYQVFFG